MPGDTGSTITAWAVFSAIGGSVVGSVIGGFISFYLQRRNLAAAESARDEDRIEIRKAIGYSLLFKLIRLASDLDSLGKAVRQTLDKAKEAGFIGSPFQIVMPLGPLPDPVKFSPDEMGLVLSMDAKLFNEMAALDELHNSTVSLFELYNTQRTSVMERFGAEMSGNIGTTRLTESDRQWLAPRAVELNSLVDLMLQRAEQDGKEAWTALGSFHSALQTNFNIKFKLERMHPETVPQDKQT
jgi:hypothetical protein